MGEGGRGNLADSRRVGGKKEGKELMSEYAWYTDGRGRRQLGRLPRSTGIEDRL